MLPSLSLLHDGFFASSAITIFVEDRNDLKPTAQVYSNKLNGSKKTLLSNPLSEREVIDKLKQLKEYAH